MTSNKAGKAMSSRLLTMKFMQRAAASPASDSAPPTSVSAAPQGPLAKRQKTSHVKEVITPADVKAVQAAVAAEEAKRAEAIERQAAEIGETRWALSFMEDQAAHETPMAVVTAGYASLDSAVLSAPSPRENRNGVSRSEKVGRISYGNYKSRREWQPDPSSPPVPTSDSNQEDEDDPSGVNALIRDVRSDAGDRARAEREATRNAENAESNRLAKERRHKEVKLNTLSSISSGGRPLASPGKFTCFRCGEPGHKKDACPTLNRSGDSGMHARY